MTNAAGDRFTKEPKWVYEGQTTWGTIKLSDLCIRCFNGGHPCYDEKCQCICGEEKT